MLIEFHKQKTDKIPYISWKNTTWVEDFNPFKSKICLSQENPFDWWFDQEIPSEIDIIETGPKQPVPGSIIDHSKHYFLRKMN